MKYEEFIQARQNEYNNLPIKYAYSDKQFESMMNAWGLYETETDLIVSLGYGAYCMRCDLPEVKSFLNKDDGLKNLMETEENFAYEAFLYEMQNHEYGINWEGDYEVCNCFGKCKFEEDKTGKDYLTEMGYSDKVIQAYYKAMYEYDRLATENDWF